MHILVLNPGSSTLKFAFFKMEGGTETPLVRDIIEGSAGKEAVGKIIASLTESVDAVVCRVVHGGGGKSVVHATPQVLQAIRDLAPLAPLHNPLDADVIEAAQKALPDAHVIAVCDTGFHRSMPHAATTYALPYAVNEKYNLRRYGFHGISHQYVSGELLRCLKKAAKGTRLITCHLGNGASVCAIRDGKSVDTSMGMTPLEGLVMGTRSGDVDPGLLLYLLREKKMTPDELDDMLNHKSGLLGLSGISADMRELEKAAANGNRRVERAMKIFAYRVRKYIGAYAAALGGVDAIAFAGGIGEHSFGIRERICRDLEFLGLHFDAKANSNAKGNETARITKADSSVAVWVIPTDEEKQMAREAFALLSPKRGK